MAPPRRSDPPVVVVGCDQDEIRFALTNDFEWFVFRAILELTALALELGCRRLLHVRFGTYVDLVASTICVYMRSTCSF